MLALAVISIVRKIRKGRAERAALLASEQPACTVMLELEP